jgi:hypothetical protein
MIVDGQIHSKDLKMIKERVILEWWRKEDHRLHNIDDIEDIISASPEVLVIGMGYAEKMQVEKRLKAPIEEKNIRLIPQNTAATVKTFNKLEEEVRAVAAVFHLTC